MSFPEKPTVFPLGPYIGSFIYASERTSAVLTEKAQCELIEGVGAYEERRAVVDYLCRIGYFDIAEDIGARRHLGNAPTPASLETRPPWPAARRAPATARPPSRKMEVVAARFRRWLHLLRHGLRHRALTGHGDRGVTFIGCDCGELFYARYARKI